jgi:hypothetical protein
MHRINFRGLNIRIEQKVGSVREGVGKNGNRWKVRFYRPYGFISDTMGKDGDEIDCFIGDHWESDNVYIVHQLRPDGLYDEDKVMLGFLDLGSARDGYLAHFNTQGFIGKITTMPFFEFKEKVKTAGSITRNSFLKKGE